MSNILIETFKNTKGKRNLFLTGPAGSGKSYIVKEFIEWFHKVDTYGHLAVLAPTSIAALNVGGRTLASFFQTTIFEKINEIDLTKYKKSNKYLKHILETDFIIIDEISMVSHHYLNTIDIILKTLLKNSRPFGGIILIFVGDFLQLPPIDKREYWEEQATSKNWAFKAPCWDQARIYNICLNENKRQDDREFISNLWDIRTGNITYQNLIYFDSKKTILEEDKDKVVRLYATNKEVNFHNDYYLNELKTKEIVYEYIGQDLVDVDQSNLKKLKEQLKPLNNEKVIIKLGARMMLIANINLIAKLVNGLIGTVVGINKFNEGLMIDEQYRKDIDKVSKNIPLDTVEGVFMYFDELEEVRFIKHYNWNLTTKVDHGVSNSYIIQNIVDNEFEEDNNEEEVNQNRKNKIVAIYSQIPLKLAYAFTIHKAQGLTFNYLYIDFKSFFEVNHAYVALSRIKNINKSYLINIEHKHLKVDNEALNFVNNLKEGK